MTNRSTGAGRICGEQDCNDRTSRPNHPLCYPHYQESQDGDINECPNHPGVYKPSEFPICRSCFRQNQQTAQAGVGQQPQDDSGGWDRKATAVPLPAPPKSAVAAVELARRNLPKRESINWEDNTIQYLIDPIVEALGWNYHDTEQVVRQYKPVGNQRVDIALLVNGAPKVFIEVKRRDHDYDQEFEEQLTEYASHLKHGTAVLTNGRFWHIYAVSNGKANRQHIIDITKRRPEDVALELNNAVGWPVVNNVPATAAPAPSPQRRNRPQPVAQQRDREAIVADLREYRERQRKQRRQPAYTILKDEAIELIATQRPTDLQQLANVRGIGPSTLRQHGDAILSIVLETDSDMPW